MPLQHQIKPIRTRWAYAAVCLLELPDRMAYKKATLYWKTRTMTLTDTNPITRPELCESMAEVREGVDSLDRQLIALIAERTGYMEAAARIKPSRDVVRDEWRIEDVISKVKAEAERVGLPTAIAEPVWRELVEQSIAYELKVWDKTR